MLQGSKTMRCLICLYVILHQFFSFLGGWVFKPFKNNSRQYAHWYFGVVWTLNKQFPYNLLKVLMEMLIGTRIKTKRNIRTTDLLWQQTGSFEESPAEMRATKVTGAGYTTQYFTEEFLLQSQASVPTNSGAEPVYNNPKTKRSGQRRRFILILSKFIFGQDSCDPVFSSQ